MMKKKDILALVISVAIIGASVFFMLQLLSPAQDDSTLTTESDAIPAVPDSIDETTYKNIENLSDYGGANLEGIGKRDLFSKF
jgi:hypothetical protein